MHAIPCRRILPFALIVLCTGALAQTTESDRVSRRCTGATLSTDSTAPCPDDVIRDRNFAPPVIRPTTGITEPGTTTPTTTGGAVTPGTPVTSGGITPGATSTSVGSTPGAPVTSGGSTPGTPATSGGSTPGTSAGAASALPNRALSRPPR
jgi:hypothetical protein